MLLLVVLLVLLLLTWETVGLASTVEFFFSIRAGAALFEEAGTETENIIMIENLFSTLYTAMMQSFGLALLVSVIWGVLSILLSPCHLSSIPLVIGFIMQQEKKTTGRARPIRNPFSTPKSVVNVVWLRNIRSFFTTAPPVDGEGVGELYSKKFPGSTRSTRFTFRSPRR